MPRRTKEEEELRIIEMYTYERQAHKEGYSLIAGVDEAGRGPLAGPVYAAAVILPDGCIIEGINDSKKLSEKKREDLYDIIKEKAIAYSAVSINEKVIDEINILKATHLAMKKAVDSLLKKPDFVIIDGNSAPDLAIPHTTLVKGDSKSISVAAASIIAKVERDRYIKEMANVYPEYGFERHKGYGTKVHTESILKYGPSPIHRKTFLKKLLGDDIK